MKRIGFIDYFIDEWHACHYTPLIRELSRELCLDIDVAYAWAEMTDGNGGRSTAEWCADYGVTPCETIEELCERSDYILILAPSNPETHLRYAETALRYGKNTYIDKTFAPDTLTAKRIFELSEKYGTKLFSSSALRYASEIADYAGNVKRVITTGGGSNFPEYIIHQIEPTVKLLGTGANNFTLTRDGYAANIELRYPDGRSALMHYEPSLPFTAEVTDSEGICRHHALESDYFRALLTDILRFFDEGTVSFDSNETIEVMKIRSSLINAYEANIHL